MFKKIFFAVILYCRNTLNWDMMMATNRNDIKEVSKLLRTCKDMDISTLDHALGNSLYCAAEKGHVNILQYMLDNYANVNFEYSDEKKIFQERLL